MAFVARKSVPVGDEVLAAAIMAAITPFLLLLLSWSEHFRSTRPSMVLNTYLLLTLLLDAVLVRTSWLTLGGRRYTVSLTVKVALKMVMVVLEAVPKRRWRMLQSQDTSPEETSGVYSLALMSWLRPLISLGSRQALDLEDLYPLDRRLAAARQLNRFQNLRKASSMNPTDSNLLRDLARTLGAGLLQPIVPRILLMGFSFAQPFFIQRLIRYLQGGDSAPVYLERNLGYGLIGASFFIYLGIALSTAMYWYLHFRTIMKLRATLSTAIFAKTCQVSSHTLDDSVLTLMSTDVSRVVGGIQNVHELWSNTIEVALAAWLLERQLGAAFVAPIVVVVICIACTTVVAKGAASRQGEWTKKTQNRVTVISSVIGHIKAILISGRAEHLASMVQKLRDDELRSGNRFRILMVFSTCVAFAPMLVSPLMTFAVTARSLDTAQVYASLAYLTLLASPLTQLFQTLPNMLASKASLERIQTFLAAPSRVDYRLNILSTERSSAEKSETSGGGPTISFHDVSLGWEEAKWQLCHLNMVIPSSELTIIRGPVASGKSTLSRALLGEVPFIEGKVEFSSAYGKIGFCAQTPFLTNGTIRSNIIGFELFDSSRYESILQATLLKLDIDSLPERDETRVGSGGLTLSGGQKQRVALARALYLDADLYIIDNALSGLDTQTADKTVHRVFGPTGLLREKKATVVWCTESTKYLPLEHRLIILGANNTWEYCGPSEEDPKNYVALSDPESEVLSNTTPSLKQASKKSKEASAAQHDSGVYSHYRAAIGPSVTTAVLLFGCCFSFSYNFGTVWLNFWSEDVFKRLASQSHSFYLGIYGLIQISGLISLGMYVGSTNMIMVTRGGSHLHLRAIRSLFSMPLSYFVETDRGASTNLFSQDMALVDGPLSFISNTLLSGFTALGQAVVVAVATPWVAIGYPVLLGVLYLLQRYYLKTSRQLLLLDLESKSPI